MKAAITKISFRSILLLLAFTVSANIADIPRALAFLPPQANQPPSLLVVILWLALHLVGLAAVFVAAGALYAPDAFGIGHPGSIAAASLIEMALGVAIGAITNVASAILMEPKIIERIVIVWLGGHALYWPHTREFNLAQDVPAARIVFDSGVPLVQLPCTPIVTHFTTTVPEMERTDAMLRAIYDSAGGSDKYRCSYYPGPHKFDLDMQAEAFAWFDQWLGAEGDG